jgi:hypothetical protein
MPRRGQTNLRAWFIPLGALFWYFTSTSLRLVLIPFAMVFLLVLWQVRWNANRRRSRVGLCEGCGYDLRASPERCPECGRSVSDTHVR